MASARNEQDFATLRVVLAAFPDGASLEQIAAEARLPVSERTLIRRLADMVGLKMITKSGQSRAARYTFVGGAARPILPPAVQTDLFVPVSKSSAKIQVYLRKPPEARKIVGYERAFLDGYRPN